MRLADLYQAEGPQVLAVLAKKTGANAKYLYQCAVLKKTPGPALGWRLVAADPRLQFEDLYLHHKPRRRRGPSTSR